MEIPTGLVAALGALFGGAGVKVVERVLTRPDVEYDHAAKLRDELREEISGLRAEIQRCSSELKDWRDKYYTLLDEHVTLKAQCILLKTDLGELRTRLT